MKPAPPVTRTCRRIARVYPTRRLAGPAQAAASRAPCLPGERRDPRHPGGREMPAGRGPRSIRVERRGDRVRVVGIDEHRGVARHLGQGRHVRRQHREARGERLEHREPEPLVERRIREERGAGQQRELVARRSRSRCGSRAPAPAGERRDRRARTARPPRDTTAPVRRRSPGEISSGRAAARTPAPAARGSSAARCRRRTARTRPAIPCRRRTSAIDRLGRRAERVRVDAVVDDVDPRGRRRRRAREVARGAADGTITRAAAGSHDRTAGATARRCAAPSPGTCGTRGRARSARRPGWLSPAAGSSSRGAGRSPASHSSRGTPSRLEAGWKTRAGNREAFSCRFGATSAKNRRGREQAPRVQVPRDVTRRRGRRRAGAASAAGVVAHARLARVQRRPSIDRRPAWGAQASRLRGPGVAAGEGTESQSTSTRLWSPTISRCTPSRAGVPHLDVAAEDRAGETANVRRSCSPPSRSSPRPSLRTTGSRVRPRRPDRRSSPSITESGPITTGPRSCCG